MDKFFWKFHEVKGLWPHCKYTMSIIPQNHVCSWWWTTKFSGSSHHSVTTHLYSDYSRVLYHYVCITVRLVFFYYNNVVRRQKKSESCEFVIRISQRIVPKLFGVKCILWEKTPVSDYRMSVFSWCKCVTKTERSAWKVVQVRKKISGLSQLQ